MGRKKWVLQVLAPQSDGAELKKGDGGAGLRHNAKTHTPHKYTESNLFSTLFLQKVFNTEFNGLFNGLILQLFLQLFLQIVLSVLPRSSLRGAH